MNLWCSTFHTNISPRAVFNLNSSGPLQFVGKEFSQCSSEITAEFALPRLLRPNNWEKHAQHTHKPRIGQSISIDAPTLLFNAKSTNAATTYCHRWSQDHTRPSFLAPVHLFCAMLLSDVRPCPCKRKKMRHSNSISGIYLKITTKREREIYIYIIYIYATFLSLSFCLKFVVDSDLLPPF